MRRRSDVLPNGPLTSCPDPCRQGLRVLNSANDGPCAFPEVEFTEGNGKAISVSSCRAGFYADGSLETCKHSLVELLQVPWPRRVLP